MKVRTPAKRGITCASSGRYGGPATARAYSVPSRARDALPRHALRVRRLGDGTRLYSRRVSARLRGERRRGRDRVTGPRRDRQPARRARARRQLGRANREDDRLRRDERPERARARVERRRAAPGAEPAAEHVARRLHARLAGTAVRDRGSRARVSDLVVRNARLLDGRLVDLAAESGSWTRIEESIPSDGAQELDADGRLAT